MERVGLRRQPLSYLRGSVRVVSNTARVAERDPARSREVTREGSMPGTMAGTG